MPVATQQHDARCPCVADQREQAFALLRDIRPFFEDVFIADDLDAATDESDLRRLFQLALEPFPLLRAEERRIWVVVGHVRFDAWEARIAAALPGLQRTSVVAAVKQDDLYALSLGAEDFRVIHARTGPPWRTRWFAEEC